MGVSFAYLSAGRMCLKRDGEPVVTVDSHYARQARERAVQIQQRNAWKTAGTGARFMSGGAVWGRGGPSEAVLRTQITGLTRGPGSGEVYYALETSDVSGVFLLRDAGAQEDRLFHTTDYHVAELSLRDDHEMLTCVVGYRDGSSNIGIMQSDGSGLTEVTQGDAIDRAPHWVPGCKNQLVFQSAGIGRTAQGLAMGQSPFAIHKVDTERGEVTCLAEDPDHDLLAPQLLADGTLYYIRRPYRGATPKLSPGRALLDFVLFPFRLFHALFQYLNFFSVSYTGKPLTTAGGQRQKMADVRQMMIWGNLIQADKSTQSAEEEVSALVPDSWQLVRRSPNGQTTTLAKSVVSFDLCKDGTLICSNGNAILHLGQDGTSQWLHKDKLIEHVVACE